MVVHPFSHGDSSCPVVLRIRALSLLFRLRDSHPLSSTFPCRSATSARFMHVLTPKILLLSVWPPPLSLATTRGISLDFFSSPYLDVSVQAVPFIYLLIQYMIRSLLLRGFPHSDTRGSMLICSSPRLFAACRVLLRLLMPRHSPCALSSLTFSRLIFLD